MSNERWTEKGCWEWIEDCQRWRGEVLHGRFMHWCLDWDCLPVDETTPEWPCACASPEERMESAAMLLALPLPPQEPARNEEIWRRAEEVERLLSVMQRKARGA